MHDVTSMTNSAIMQLLEFALKDCYFLWADGLYRQVSGLPMGGRLSPIIANIFMEQLEYRALLSGITIPRLYLRYVDDIFIIWDSDRGNYLDFLEFLNNLHPDIRFMLEEEKEGSLAFLDVRVTRPGFSNENSKHLKNTDKVQIAVYRKETHVDRYLNYRSAHPLSTKRKIVHGLWLRAMRLLKDHPIQLAEELNHLKRAFSGPNNAYPWNVLTRWYGQFREKVRENPAILKVRTRLTSDTLFDRNGQQRFYLPTAEMRLGQNEVQTPDPQVSALEMDLMQQTIGIGTPVVSTASGTSAQAAVGLLGGDVRPSELMVPKRQAMVIPFVPGLGEYLRQIAKQHDITTWFSFPGKISQLFTKHRGRSHLSKSQNVIYSTQCSCGLEYIGESRRNLKIRVNEHLQNSSNSAQSIHLKENRDEGHFLVSPNTVVLARERNTLKRKIIETLCIEHSPAKLCNTGASVELPMVWNICAEGLDKQLKTSASD